MDEEGGIKELDPNEVEGESESQLVLQRGMTSS